MKHKILYASFHNQFDDEHMIATMNEQFNTPNAQSQFLVQMDRAGWNILQNSYTKINQKQQH